MISGQEDQWLGSCGRNPVDIEWMDIFESSKFFMILRKKKPIWTFAKAKLYVLIIMLHTFVSN